MSDGHLSGKHAVVTGGGRGIGAAIARALAQHGATLTLMGQDRARLESRGRELAAQAVTVDVADADSVAAAFEQATTASGPVHILVNNAGAAASAPFVRTDLGLWKQMLEINLTGTYLCCKQALPGMLDGGFGRVVNIASTAGLTGYPFVTAYCAAKHGVVGLTRALAEELRGDGIAVNAVCPGSVDTDMLRVGMPGAKPDMSPADVAGVVLYLAAEAPAALTGAAIDVFG